MSEEIKLPSLNERVIVKVAQHTPIGVVIAIHRKKVSVKFKLPGCDVDERKFSVNDIVRLDEPFVRVLTIKHGQGDGKTHLEKVRFPEYHTTWNDGYRSPPFVTIKLAKDGTEEEIYFLSGVK